MKTIFTLLYLLTSYALIAQSIDRQVTASSGNAFISTSFNVTYTIGEPAIGYINNSVTISQGFLARLESDNSLSTDGITNKNTIKLYPNPVVEYLSIDLENLSSLQLRLFTVSGKLLHDMVLKEKDNTINLSHLPNGTYLISLEFKDSKKIKSFKIIKE